MAEVAPQGQSFAAMLREDAEWAERATGCLRRGTAARIIDLRTRLYYLEMNRPTLGCTNQKGDCSCAHAEQLAIVGAMQHVNFKHKENLIVLTTLSPCTACANLIVACGFIQQAYWLRPLEHDLRGQQVLAAGHVAGERL